MCSHLTQTALKVWLILAVLAAAATCAPAQWSLDTVLVRNGEWWRLISGHLVHLTWQHYLYDLLALGLALCFCGWLAESFAVVVVAALSSAAAVSLAVMVLQPVEIYGGLSGVTAGLLAWGALQMFRHDAPITGLALVLGMLVKIRMEQYGVSVSGVEAVWQAHCAGALAGALVAVVYQPIVRYHLQQL